MLVPTTEEEKSDFRMAGKIARELSGDFTPKEREAIELFHYSAFRLYKLCGARIAKANLESAMFALRGMVVARKMGII